MSALTPIQARIDEIASEIVRLQGELDREIFKRRDVLGWRLHEGLVEFEHGIVIEHQRVKRGAATFIASAPPATVLTAPVIYSLILPLALMDLWASAYQAVCFRAYRLPRVHRSDYLVFDREALAYLNWIERLNCWFCEYANGVAAYVREIASRTEQYWCPIKHAFKVTSPHKRYQAFVDYGDAEGYRDRLTRLRAALRAEGSSKPLKFQEIREPLVMAAGALSGGHDQVGLGSDSRGGGWFAHLCQCRPDAPKQQAKPGFAKCPKVRRREGTSDKPECYMPFGKLAFKNVGNRDMRSRKALRSPAKERSHRQGNRSVPT